MPETDLESDSPDFGGIIPIPVPDREKVMPDIIGKSLAVRIMIGLCWLYSKLPWKVLIQGETGTGKELCAHAIHDCSNRKDKPFIAVNCAGVPEGLLESTLFGWVKGAFTGAIKDVKGVFELANGGTLFLDEIGEMPRALFAKLLRVLEDMLVTPVGGSRAVKVDVRIISATNRNLKQEMKAGRFPADLFWRLRGLVLPVPPLRQRRADIPLITDHLIAKCCREAGRPVLSVSPEVRGELQPYSFPGNIRELYDIVLQLVALETGAEITLKTLQCAREILRQFDETGEPEEKPVIPPQGLNLKEYEGYLARDALLNHNWNLTRAAKSIGRSRWKLRQIMKYANITPPPDAPDQEN